MTVNVNSTRQNFEDAEANYKLFLEELKNDPEVARGKYISMFIAVFGMMEKLDADVVSIDGVELFEFYEKKDMSNVN